MYNQNRRLEAIKFTGYLQRLGISHLLVSLAQLALPFDPRKKKLTGYLSPRYWLRMAFACLLPLLNLTVSLTFSQDSCSVVGYLGPVIKQPSEDCYAGGANFAVDRLLMGESRIPMQTRCSNLLSCGRFDEDGILGTLNFVFGVFLGSCAGLYFLQYKKAYMRQFRHFSTQIILLCSITVSLTGFGVYSIIPINNQLWSLSYVLVCSALSLAFYIAVTALIVQKKWRGWPFRAVGKNALFILFTHQLFKTRFPFGYHHNGNKFDSTLSCLLNCSVWIGIAIVLHGYRFYIKY